MSLWGRAAVAALVMVIALFALPSIASADPDTTPPPAPEGLEGPSFVSLGDDATFTFDDTIAGDVDHYVCTFAKRVGGVFETVEEVDPCTSPLTYSDLTTANYAVVITAVDEAGNVSEPAGIVFLVADGAPPAGTGFTFNGPADGSAQSGPMTGFSGRMDTTRGGFPQYRTRYLPTYRVEIDRVSLDSTLTRNATFSEFFHASCFGCVNINWTDETPAGSCLFPTYKVTKSGSLPSAEGQYRIVAFQRGNPQEGNPPDIFEIRSFTIDRTAPDTEIDSSPAPGSNISPTFTFSGTDPDPTDGRGSGVDSYECSINGGTWAACESGDPLPQTAPEGENTLEVRAFDRAGNRDATPATTTFIVDLTPPDITIDKPLNKDRYLLHEGPTPVFSCVDPLVGVPPATPAASGVASCTATPINDEDLGPHYFTVTAVDNAGNTSTKSVVYTIDPPDYGKFIKQSNPLAHYRFNEALGSDSMIDSSGNNHNGIYQNGIALQRDGATACERRPHPPRSCELANPAENKAAFFPARDGHGYVNGITAPKTAYTMEAWVKPRSGANMMVMSHGGGGQLFIQDGKLAFRQVQDTINSNAAVEPGKWTHVAATWDGSVTRLFVNGSQVASSSTANKAPSGTSTFYIGYGEMAPWFNGEIDEAAYYETAVSSHLIRERWKVGVAKDEKSLVRGNSPFNTEGPFTDPQSPKNGGLYAPTKTPNADFTCSDVDDLPGDSDIASCTATIDGNPIANGAPLPDSIGTHTLTVTAVDKGGNEYIHHHVYAVKTFKDLFNTDAPVLYCRLGELSGSAMVDSSGNNRNGEFKNDQESGPVGISGDGDRARDFFGKGGYGFVNNVAAPRFQSTLEAWVNPKDGRDQSIVGHGDAGELFIKGGQFKYRRMGETVTSSVPVAVGEWQQVVGTWDGADIRIFINGVETGKTESSRRPSSVSTFYVGFGELAPWFYGAIDEVAYYPVALNANRVYQHWLADPPPEELTSAPDDPNSPPDEPTIEPDPSVEDLDTPVSSDDDPKPDLPVVDEDPSVEPGDGSSESSGPKVTNTKASKAKARKRQAKVKKCKKISKKSKRKACLKRARRI